MASKFVYCVESVTTFHNGVRVRTARGEKWPANDPFVKARPELFVTDPDARDVAHTAPVETMTAAPGEKRSTRRTRSSGDDDA